MKLQRKRGGARLGAGRRKNNGFYGEPTRAARLPVSGYSFFLALIKQLWGVLKHQAAKSELLPLIFKDLEEALERSLALRCSSEGLLMGSDEGAVSVQSHQDAVQSLSVLRVVQRSSVGSSQNVRFFPSAIAASFDIAATSEQDNPGNNVDLHQMLIQDPVNTFLLTVVGDSMNQAGIHDGDLIIVQQITDAWAQLKSGLVVAALVDGVQTIKRFEKRKGKDFLVPDSDNPEHQPLQMNKQSNIEIFGLVRYAIHPMSKYNAFLTGSDLNE
jgi:DNA polymerase V